MEFKYQFQNLQNEVKELSEKTNRLAEAYAEAEDFTVKFLKACSKRKIKLVSIGRRTDLIQSAKDWPFNTEGDVFADDKDERSTPTIWRVVEEMKISSGCGNLGQHTLSKAGNAKLINGVYRFQDGKWTQIE